MSRLENALASLKQIQKQAAEYDPDALFELAAIYENPPTELGGLIQKDLDEALWYYCASVWAAYKQGDIYGDSAYNAGRLLYNGTDKRQDTYLAYHYLSLAADAGSDEAAYELGRYHTGLGMEEGCGYERIPALGFSYFQAAAEQENPYAYLALGACNVQGLGVLKNKSVAARWYVMAANSGLVEGMYSAGVCLESLGNYQDAGYWFNEALCNGHDEAANRLRRYKYNHFYDVWQWAGD